MRDAYGAFTGGAHTDVWLMLGDNAYFSGTDPQFQAAVFDMYPEYLRQTPLWPTRGNHEMSAPVYYGNFTLPSAAEAGGLASGSEAYYSFDHANVHFVCLDSHGTDRSVGGAMWTWLQNDLAATDQDWIIAYWHHPPYSKGSHDSDTELQLIEMRENFLPLLEAGGVDLVLPGHSHSYERSYLIDGHYGHSSTFTDAMKKDPGDGDPAGDGPYQKAVAPNAGAVYAVAGSSGQITPAPVDHPVMLVNLVELGSLVIDVDGERMDVQFLDALGQVDDSFTILTHPDEGLTADTTVMSIAGGGSQNYTLDAGVEHADKLYILLGSSTGTEPGTPAGNGFTLPLNFDGFLTFTLTHPNSSALVNTLGSLDGAGTASASVVTPAGALSVNFIGRTLHFAYDVLNIPGDGAVQFVSNAHPLTFVP